jgi:hypothetical protein
VSTFRSKRNATATLVDLATAVDVGAPVDTRGTRSPSPRTLLRRQAKAEKQRLAIASANEAGYRRGRDEQDRLNTIRQDAEVNILRNQIADIQAATIATMDREFVKGWLAVCEFQNRINPSAETFTISMRQANAIARELSRAYDKEKQS